MGGGRRGQRENEGERKMTEHMSTMGKDRRTEGKTVGFFFPKRKDNINKQGEEVGRERRGEGEGGGGSERRNDPKQEGQAVKAFTKSRSHKKALPL